MGNLFSNFLIMATTLQKQRRMVPQTVLRFASLQDRMLLCGGVPGSIGEDQRCRLVERRIKYLMAKKIPAVILCRDDGFADLMYDCYGDTLTVFGQNAAYDPFRRSQEPEKQLQEMLDRSDLPAVRSHAQQLGVFCRHLVMILRFLYPGEAFSCEHFLEIAGRVKEASAAREFFDGFGKEFVFPTSLLQDVYGVWDTVTEPFAQFAEAFRQSFGRLTPRRSKSRRTQIAAELPEDGIVLLPLSSREEPAACAVWDELQMLCRKEHPFYFVDCGIPLPAKTAETILEPKHTVSFLFSFASLEEEPVPLELLSQRLYSLICVGVSSYAEAKWIAALAEKMQDPEAESELHPALLLAGRRGIPDGGACLLTPYSLECCAWLSV